jgi:hypothetical protein
MPATPTRIQFITEEFRVATAGPDATVEAKYGSLARDTDTPIPTMFDDIRDVQAVANDRHALLKGDRRRLQVTVQGEDQGMALAYAVATPCVRAIDDQRALDMNAAVVEFGIDFDKGNTSLVVWG